MSTLTSSSEPVPVFNRLSLPRQAGGKMSDVKPLAVANDLPASIALLPGEIAMLLHALGSDGLATLFE
ncbi:MAG: hypothetical protein ACRYG4_12110 [Janthinobacterium lividum]